jgi:hypothetical protein
MEELNLATIVELPLSAWLTLWVAASDTIGTPSGGCWIYGVFLETERSPLEVTMFSFQKQQRFKRDFWLIMLTD